MRTLTLNWIVYIITSDRCIKKSKSNFEEMKKKDNRPVQITALESKSHILEKRTLRVQ